MWVWLASATAHGQGDARAGVERSVRRWSRGARGVARTAGCSAARTRGPWRRCHETGGDREFDVGVVGLGNGARPGRRAGGRGELGAAVVARGSGGRSNGGVFGRANPGAVAPLPRDGRGSRVRCGCGWPRQRRTARATRGRAWSARLGGGRAGIGGALERRGVRPREPGGRGAVATRRAGIASSMWVWLASATAHGQGDARAGVERSARRWSRWARGGARTAGCSAARTRGPWRRCHETGGDREFDVGVVGLGNGARPGRRAGGRGELGAAVVARGSGGRSNGHGSGRRAGGRGAFGSAVVARGSGGRSNGHGSGRRAGGRGALGSAAVARGSGGRSNGHGSGR
jgi:hypothetical protein